MDKDNTESLNTFQIKWMVDNLMDDLEQRYERDAKEAAKGDVDDAKEEGRTGALEEIVAELESAIESAEDEGAPAVGTEGDWGKGDLPGLQSFLNYLQKHYV